jgi:hypothetical protein
VSLPDKIVLQPEVFQGSYALSRIEYCGIFTGYPVTPTCPPERKAAADKAAADKAAADKAAAELKARKEAVARENAELKAAAAVKAAAAKKTTITCVKGKATKKVTAVKPKCPTGYKVKK